MTAQVGERLVIESQELTMCTESLECWFERLRGQSVVSGQLSGRAAGPAAGVA